MMFLFGVKLRSVIIYSLNQKLCTLTKLIAKKNNVGKLINILSTDLNII